MLTDKPGPQWPRGDGRMKRKEEELISVLLQQNEPMSAKDLSERLGVSDRKSVV